MLGYDGGVDAAADVPLRLEPHVAGLGGTYEVVEDPVGDRLMKRPLVAVGPNVELERLQLHAQPVGDVVERERGEIGLPGHGADAGELRNLHVDPVVALGRRVGKRFQRLAGTRGHRIDLRCEEADAKKRSEEAGSEKVEKSGKPDPEKILSDGIIFGDATNSNKAVWF